MMRKTDNARAFLNNRRDEAPTHLVCLALVLSLVSLAGRIMSVW